MTCSISPCLSKRIELGVPQGLPLTLTHLFPQNYNLCLFLISINAVVGDVGHCLWNIFFFFKLNITLTLFEGLNSGTFTDEIIPKMVSSDKSCYSFEQKQFKFTSTQKGLHKKTVNTTGFQRTLDSKSLTDIQ